jgi:hypothetical protein
MAGVVPGCYSGWMSLSLPVEPPEDGPLLPRRLTIDLSPGRFFLVIGPRSVCYPLTCLVAGLAEVESVRVIDAGNPLVPPLLHQLIRGRQDVRGRIREKQAVTCRSLLSMLEAEPASPLPLILLDLLSPFYDGSVQLSVRKDILSACLYQLQRLRAAAAGAVSLSPPQLSLRSAHGLLRQVLAEAPRLFSAQLIFPGKSLRRLY